MTKAALVEAEAREAAGFGVVTAGGGRKGRLSRQGLAGAKPAVRAIFTDRPAGRWTSDDQRFVRRRTFADPAIELAARGARRTSLIAEATRG